MVEIHVDFANYFYLDPTSEIRLNPMGKIMLKYILIYTPTPLNFFVESWHLYIFSHLVAQTTGSLVAS